MASGSEQDFRPEQGKLVARRELRRGFGVRLRLVEQSEGPRYELRGGSRSYGTGPVAGAAILADGEQVATSDANGFAELELPRPPARIEVALSGWRVLDSREFAGGIVRSFPSADVWMIRE